MAWDQLRSSYDQVAADYEDRFLDELGGKPRDRELLVRFGFAALDPVVEVGCGPGQIGAFVRSQGRTVLGLDLSAAMATAAGLRLDGAVQGDLRRLPLATDSVGGLIAFYSLIHLRRSELGAAWVELARVLRFGGRVLMSAHEGEGEQEADSFLGHEVPFVATLFQLDELVAAVEGAGLRVDRAERRPPYADEHPTTRLYLEAVKPRSRGSVGR